MGRFKLPQALTASRSVALSKPGGGVRPIAVGESIMRLLAIISFKRVKLSAIDFFRPYQFAIGIPDGTTCAALCTDLFFNQKNENYLMNIDFKNAFNSVFRSSVLQKLELHYLPLMPSFPSSLPAVPSRSSANLHLAVVKLQRSVLIGFEDLDFSKRLKPLLKHCSDDNLFNSRRGDIIAPFVDSSQVVVDFTTVDPFAFVYRDDVLLSTNGHLNKAEDRKRDEYTEILNDLNKNLYSKFSFVPFAFSIFGNIGQSALNLITDFANLCRSSGKNFAGNLWKNRIIFTLYRNVPKYLSLMMSKLYKDSSRVGVENLVSYVF
ncbi:hypothetical protein P9112_010821 [Eukaryota sp. TZLM1-RC]